MLGTGRGSRLHQTLVRDRQLASAASAFTFDLSKGSDLLVVDATARPGVSLEALETGVADVLNDVAERGLRDGELDRVLAQIETDFVTSMQGAGDRAEQLSRFATYFGEPRLLNDQLQRYRAVTAEEVWTMARGRLGPDNRASLAYVPRLGGGS
jgi:predicted Zn-dependent peptidase